MTITLADLKQRILDRVDPDVLIEWLNISTEQLVEAFSDEIEDHFEKLAGELYEEDE